MDLFKGQDMHVAKLDDSITGGVGGKYQASGIYCTRAIYSLDLLFSFFTLNPEGGPRIFLL